MEGDFGENFDNRISSMDSQSILTIATPFLVFGALLAVLILVWDR